MGGILPMLNDEMNDIRNGQSNRSDMDRKVRDLSGTSLRLRQSMTPNITDAVRHMVKTAIVMDDSIIAKALLSLVIQFELKVTNL
jgi:hypothetical protein